jgi:ATP-dependent Clp protease adaptor protein ClpS
VIQKPAMSNFNQPDILELEITETVVKEEAVKALVLYNDDVNTFEFVTQSLITVCGHDSLQAEQCTYLIHYTGKCAVKNGTFKKLKPLCQALLDRGLSAQIEN